MCESVPDCVRMMYWGQKASSPTVVLSWIQRLVLLGWVIVLEWEVTGLTPHDTLFYSLLTQSCTWLIAQTWHLTRSLLSLSLSVSAVRTCPELSKRHSSVRLATTTCLASTTLLLLWWRKERLSYCRKVTHFVHSHHVLSFSYLFPHPVTHLSSVYIKKKIQMGNLFIYFSLIL